MDILNAVSSLVDTQFDIIAAIVIVMSFYFLVCWYSHIALPPACGWPCHSLSIGIALRERCLKSQRFLNEGKRIKLTPDFNNSSRSIHWSINAVEMK